MTAPESSDAWATALLQYDRPHSLVSIAREGRLLREIAGGWIHVHLSQVDESVLTLVDLALQKHRNVAFLYPAPAGDVCVLLAGEIILQAFTRHVQSPSVGLVTGDAVGASRVWEGLRIASPHSRTPLSEVFPSFRASPEGHSPFGGRRFQGVLIGQRFSNWPVDVAVVDHLAGPVWGDVSAPAIHVFSDPLDPAIELLHSRGELVWGWAPFHLAGTAAELVRNQDTFSPFSVAEARLHTIGGAVRTTIHVVKQHGAERSISRIRDDLHTLSSLLGQSPPIFAAKGLRVAWNHLTTLLSLPCRPSDFDRFAGLPPVAARATSSFEPEIDAWARVFRGDLSEIASILASDLGELRTILDETNPFLSELSSVAKAETDTLVVVRTHTAARALLYALGCDADAGQLGHMCVRSIRRLRLEGSWDRAVVIGVLPRWEWHRVDSGLSSDLHLFVLGDSDARTVQAALTSLQEGRRRWGSSGIRANAWRTLIGSEPLITQVEVDPPNEIVLESAQEPVAPVDPFASLSPLVWGTPLGVGDEGVEEAVAEEAEGGDWSAAVEAVDIHTNHGVITLPATRFVEIREHDDIVNCRCDRLRPGACLLIGRREGRLGLLEALADRLRKSRPDLYAATLLISDLRASIRRAFRTSNITKSELYDRLIALGFGKTYQAARGYVEEGGPLAPRDVDDLRRLNQALQLTFTERRISEIFNGVQRIRVFRRAAGRALASAARGSVVASDVSRIDQDTGLSLADLRDAVVEATVIEVRRRPEPVPLAELGKLELIS